MYLFPPHIYKRYWMFICLSIRPSVRSSVCPSVCSFVYASFTPVFSILDLTLILKKIGRLPMVACPTNYISYRLTNQQISGPTNGLTNGPTHGPTDRLTNIVR